MSINFILEFLELEPNFSWLDKVGILESVETIGRVDFWKSETRGWIDRSDLEFGSSWQDCSILKRWERAWGFFFVMNEEYKSVNRDFDFCRKDKRDEECLFGLGI